MNAMQRGSSNLPSSFDFFAPPLREAVAMLRTGLARGDPLLLLTGQAGTGKTTVARLLLEELDPQHYNLGGVFGSYGGGDALMSLVVQDLGLRPPMGVDTFLTLELFLRRWNDAGRDAVLLIEEAHALNADALQQLWLLAAPPDVGRPRLHVVLVAQQLPDALTELTRAGRAPPIGTHCHLRALQAAETREFVLHRLRSAGGTGQPTFGNEALDAIHERTGGVLRRINLLCDRILVFLAMEGRREVSAQLVAEVDAQLCDELCGSGLPVRQLISSVVRDQTAAARSTQGQRAGLAGKVPTAARSSAAGPVSNLAAQAPASASAATRSAPNAAERATAPAEKAAPRTTSWPSPAPAPRHRRVPPRLLAGSLLLVLFVLAGLGMPSLFRTTFPTSAADLAAQGARGQVPDPSSFRGDDPAPTAAVPGTPTAEVPAAAAAVQATAAAEVPAAPTVAVPATPAAAIPAAAAVALTAAAPRLELASPPQTATARQAMVPTTAQLSTAASVPCSGPADSLGLCAAATQAPPEARAEVAHAAPLAPPTEPTPCSPERVALGLCDAP